MFGFKQPEGVKQRTLTLDPVGNCEVAAAARVAAHVFANALTQTRNPRLEKQAAEIRAWIDAEELAANAVRAGQEVVGSVAY